MRKYQLMMLALILAATIGLSACAEKKPVSPPPPAATPADNAAPAAPKASAAPAGGSAY